MKAFPPGLSLAVVTTLALSSLVHITHGTAGNCTYELTSAVGLISSLGYPDVYPGNVQCTWHIRPDLVSSPGHSNSSTGFSDSGLVLVFIQFQTRPDEFLKIYDHDPTKTNAVQSFSGKIAANTVRETRNPEIWLQFQPLNALPDASADNYGFQIVYFVQRTELSCKDPETPSHGIKRSGNNSLGGTIVFECDRGYGLAGAPNISCIVQAISSPGGEVSLRWSDAVPKCLAVCAPPQPPEHGVYVTSSTLSLQNSAVTYSCRAPFVLSGASQRICTQRQDGTLGWDRPAPTCILQSCPLHGSDHVTLNSSSWILVNPSYPKPFLAAGEECHWLVRLQSGQRAVFNVSYVDIPTGASLTLVDQGTRQELLKMDGGDSNLEHSLTVVSATSVVRVDYIGSRQNSSAHHGFYISYIAVDLPLPTDAEMTWPNSSELPLPPPPVLTGGQTTATSAPEDNHTMEQKSSSSNNNSSNNSSISSNNNSISSNSSRNSNNSSTSSNRSSSTISSISNNSSGGSNNSNNSSSSDVGGKVAAGVVVPLVVLGVGLGLTYYCYRKRFPVRMVMGRNFGKFSNPNYARPARSHSLVREDAHTVFQQMQPPSTSSANLIIRDGDSDHPTAEYVNSAFVFDSEDADEEEVERRFRQHKGYLFKSSRGADGDETSEGSGNHDSTDGPAVYQNVDETDAASEENQHDPLADDQNDDMNTHVNVTVTDEKLSARKTGKHHRGRELQLETATLIPDECDRTSIKKAIETSHDDSESIPSDASSRSASILQDSPPAIRTSEEEVAAVTLPESGKTYVYNSSMTVKEFLLLQKKGTLGEELREALYGRNARSGSLVTHSGNQTLGRRRTQSADTIVCADKPLPDSCAWNQKMITRLQSLTSLSPEPAEESLDEEAQAEKNSIFHTYQNLSVLPCDQHENKRKEDDDASNRTAHAEIINGFQEDDNEFAETVLASRMNSAETSDSQAFTEGEASQEVLKDGHTMNAYGDYCSDILASFVQEEQTENDQEGTCQALVDEPENVHPSQEESGNVKIVPQTEACQNCGTVETLNILHDSLDNIATSTDSPPVFFLPKDFEDAGNGKDERDEDDAELSSADAESVDSHEEDLNAMRIFDLTHDQKDDSDTPSDINSVASDATTSTAKVEDEEREIASPGTIAVEAGGDREFTESSDDSGLHAAADSHSPRTLPEPPMHAPLTRIGRQDPPSKLQLISGVAFSDLSSDEYSSPSENSEESDDDETQADGTVSNHAELSSRPLQVGQLAETEWTPRDSVSPSPENGRSQVTFSGYASNESMRPLGVRRPVGLAALRSLEVTYRDVHQQADNDNEGGFAGNLTFGGTDSALVRVDAAAEHLVISSTHAQQNSADESDSAGSAFVFSNDHPDDIDV